MDASKFLGKVFVSKWGYSMVLASFYRVIKETSKMVVVEELEQRRSGEFGFSEEASAKETARMKDGKPVTFKAKKVVESDGSICIKSRFDHSGSHSYTATLWDGKPTYINTCD